LVAGSNPVTPTTYFPCSSGFTGFSSVAVLVLATFFLMFTYVYVALLWHFLLVVFGLF